MKKLLLSLYVLAILFLAFIPGQNDFFWLISGVSISFITYYYIIIKNLFSVRKLLIVSIGLRAVLMFAFPNLSDDIYRFIWDGRLIHHGINPFSFLPSEIMSEQFKFGAKIAEDAILSEIYPLLNSPDYYSIYPTFSQLIFYLSSWKIISNLFISVLIIKIFLFIAESITIYYGIKLIRHFKLDERSILWYALNPLILLEIMGNMHFEGFMICFFLLFYFTFLNNKTSFSALFLALSISTKLIPLIFLPYFVFSKSMKNWISFFLKTGVILLLIFSPILIEYQSFANSLDLYFQKFEFNASIYYLARTIGYWFSGYNLIQFIGPIMAGITFMIIVSMAWKVEKRAEVFPLFSLFALTVYLILSTTIHPWYLCLGVMLSVFTNTRYMIFWSGLVILSYAKYKGGDSFYYWCVTAEYLGLLIFMLRERNIIFSTFPGKKVKINSK